MTKTSTMSSVELLDGMSLPVHITHVFGEGKWIKLFIQFDHLGQKQITRTLDECHSLFEQSSGYLYQQQLALHTMVCANFNGKWYRAKVVAWPANANQSVTVQFLDFGNIEIINVANLRKGENYLFSMPAQATECYLADICAHITWPSEAITFCEKYILFQECIGEIVGHFESYPIVRAFKDNIPLSQSLMNNGFGIPVGSSEPKQVLPSHPPAVMHVNYPNPSTYPMMSASAGYPIQPTVPQRPTLFSGESYRVIPLEMNGSYRVYISHIVNCHKFYFQLTSSEVERNNMAQTINRFVSQAQSSLEAIGPGAPCIAQSSEDNQFHRAIMIGFHGHVCQVFFVDTGITEEHDIATLLNIPRQLIRIPLQAFECTLKPQITLDTYSFRSAVVGKLFDLQILGKTGIQYIVSLFYQNRSFLDFIQPSPQSMKSLPPVPKMVLANYRHPRLNRGDAYHVEVTYYDTLSEFYCQLVGNSIILEDIMGQLQLQHQDPNTIQRLPIYDCQPGHPVCVYHLEDLTWYRAEIVGPVENNEVAVRFVDFGTLLLVPVQDLVVMPQHLIEIPAQAVKFTLEGFEGMPASITDSNDLIRLFEELVMGKVMEADIVNIIKERHYTVSLREKGQHSNEPTINKQLLTTARNANSPPSVDVIVPMPEVGKTEKLTITSYVSPHDFFGQLCKFSLPEFQAFEDQIQSYYGKQPSKPFPLKRNQFVCTKFSENDLFYRGKILSIEGADAEVLFIDYGNKEIRDSKNIFQLDPVFGKQPQMGIQCFFKEFPKSAPADKLSELMQDCVIEVNIVSQNSDGFSVELTDFKLNTDLLKLFRGPPQVLHYTQPSLASGACVDVMVTEVKDFTYFGCQLQRHAEELESLMSEIEAYYGSQKDVCLKNPPVGTACIAKYSVDDGWYRAKVVKNLSSDSYEVLFVDYGNSEIIKGTDIKTIKPEFLKLPQQALICCIFELDDIEVSPLSIKKFEAAILNLFFTAVYYGQNQMDKHHKIDLQTKNNESVISQFVKFKQNAPENPLTDRDIWGDGESSKKTDNQQKWNQGDGKKSNQQTSNYANKSNGDWSSGKADSWNSNNGAANNEFNRNSKTKESNSESFSAMNDFDSKGRSPRSITKTSSPPKQYLESAKSKNDYEYITVKPRSYADIIIVHVVSPSEFFCQMVETSSQLLPLSDEMSVVYGTPGESIRGMKPDDPCAALSSADSTWYRAKVYNMLGHTTEVEFVDYGNKETIPTDKVKKLKSQFFDIPVQALKCSLFNILPPNGNTWDYSTIELFKKKVLDKTMIAQFVEVSPNRTCKVNLINLKMETDVVNKVLVASGYGKVGSEAKAELRFPFNLSTEIVLKHAEIPSGTKEKVEVTWCISTTEFYCQRLESKPVFTALMDQIQELYSSLTELEGVIERPQPGMYCITQFSEDKVWYRAKVSHVKGNKVGLFYVDYGNCEEVTRKYIKVLASRFQEMPMQAIQCKLNDIKPKQSLSPDIIEKYYNGETLCTFLQTLKSGYFSVNLEKSGKNVAQVLVSDGLAIKDDIPSSATSVATQLKSYKKITLKPGVEYDVAVIYGESPSIFYCHLHLSPDFKLDELMESIEIHYADKKNQVQASNLTAGSPCIAKYSQDERWYRATVISTENKDIELIFVDYGNVEVVPKSQIMTILPEFLELSEQTFHCSLHGIPSDVSEEQCNRFLETVENKDYILKVHGVQNDVHVVTLSDKSASPPMDISLEIFGLSKSTLPSQVDSKKEDAYVSHIDGLHSFYIQLASQEDSLNDLMSRIEVFGNDESENIVDPKDVVKDMICCALYTEDGAWYRAEVLSIEDNLACVKFIDYGNQDKVSLDSIKHLKAELSSKPFFATESSLHGYKATPGKETEATDAFQALVQDKSLKTTLFPNQNTTLAQLFDENGDISLQLFKKGLLVANEIKNVNEKTSNAQLKIKSLAIPEGSQQAFVSHIESIDLFYIQNALLTEEIQTLISNIQKGVSSMSNVDPNDISIGASYCTQFSEDEAWYRAEVLELTADKSLVRFVDYGNTDNTDKTNIKQLNQDMLDYPPMAIPCQLTGIEVSPGKEDEAFNLFTELTQDKELTVNFEGTKMPLTVSISDEEGGILDRLLASGAFFKKDKPSTSQNSNDLDAGLENHPSLTTYLEYILPSIENPIKMNISHISGLDSFFLQLLEHEDELTNLVGELDEYYSNQEGVDVNEVCIGMPCAAQFTEDEAWYRAEVLHMHGDEVTVRFVDYGNEDVVSLDKLKVLTETFLSIPPYAIQCQFSELQPMPDSEANVIDYFSNATMDKTLAVTFKDITNKPYHVELQTDDMEMTITQSLQSQNLVISKESTENIQIEVSLTYLPKFGPVSVPTKELSVTVAHVSKIESFFLHLDSQEEEFTAFSAALEQYYSSGEGATLATLTTGMACCSLFSEDEMWYRSEVINVTGNDVTVKFVDYGNIDTTTADCIKELTDEFLNRPPFAIECCLNNVEQIPDANATDAFVNMTQDASLVALFQCDKQTPVPVVLTNKGKPISQELLDLGVAKLKEPNIDLQIAEELDSNNTSYKDRNIPLKHKVLATVSHAVSPCEFWVQILPEASKAVDEIGKSIYNYYSTFGENKNVLIDPKKGQPCIVMSKDFGWYRSEVLDVLDDKVHVLFVDYGSTEWVGNQNVKNFKSDFFVFPPLAIKCSMIGIVPKQGTDIRTWDIEACEYLVSLLTTDKKTFLVDFVSLQDSLCNVRILDMGIDLVTVLTESGYGESIVVVSEPECDLEETLESEVNASIENKEVELQLETKVHTENLGSQLDKPETPLSTLEPIENLESEVDLPENILTPGSKDDIELELESAEKIVSELASSENVESEFESSENTLPMLEPAENILPALQPTEDLSLTVEPVEELPSMLDTADCQLEIVEENSRQNFLSEDFDENLVTQPEAFSDEVIEKVIQGNFSSDLNEAPKSPFHRPSSREDKMVPGIISQGILTEEEFARDSINSSVCVDKILPGIDGIVQQDEQIIDNEIGDELLEDSQNIEVDKKLEESLNEGATAFSSSPYVRPPSREDEIVPGIISMGLLEKEKQLLELEEADLITPKGIEEKLLSGFVNSFESDTQSPEDLKTIDEHVVQEDTVTVQKELEPFDSGATVVKNVTQFENSDISDKKSKEDSPS